MGEAGGYGRRGEVVFSLHFMVSHKTPLRRPQRGFRCSAVQYDLKIPLKFTILRGLKSGNKISVSLKI